VSDGKPNSSVPSVLLNYQDFWLDILQFDNIRGEKQVGFWQYSAQIT